ncbi:uncharacterized protein LOC127733989 isoform X2 [Mytilus californianus]|uniref:uncharacterized protein LOC127733989 isoform X2 n=1 Tax=Mytilus californianus TaxID=6549 RepID=UPI00224829FF|nr:uncharacterized protein LOC127733989 isoform X2 [Mytilus californianus]
MGDQPSKEGHQGLVKSEEHPEENVPHPHKHNYHRGNVYGNSIPNGNVFDSGGESDAQSSSSSSGARPKYTGFMSPRDSITDNHIGSQSKNMSRFSESVPDLAGISAKNDLSRIRDVREGYTSRDDNFTAKRNSFRSNEDFIGHRSDINQNRHMGVMESNVPLRKPQHSQSLRKQNITTPKSSQRGHTPVFPHTNVDASKAGLFGSQQVFSNSASVRNHKRQYMVEQKPDGEQYRDRQKPKVNSSSVSVNNISVQDAWSQFQQMQQSLEQLQHSSNEILQDLDNEERENEEWISVINKKATGIENRLLRIEEKSKDDELTLQQLADLVETIGGKFDDIEDILKTLSIHNDCDDVNNVEQLNDGEEPEIVLVQCVSEEVSPLTVSEPMPGGSKEAPDNVEEVLQDINIDYSSLPNISKDNKGYKQRCTGRSDDNRRQIRKDRKSKNKNVMKTCESEQSVQPSPGPSSLNVAVRNKETKEASRPCDQTTSPARQAKKQQPTTSHQTTSPGRPPVVKESKTSLASSYSLPDDRDDYRNLAVLASGERVLPSIQQETIPNADKFWMGLMEREREAAEKSSLPKGDGEDTYLILDTSASMEGQPFSDLMKIARNFLNGLCENAQFTQENVCIVEVGIATRVLVHKTNSRDKLLSSLGQLRQGGMSPVTGALLVVEGIIARNSTPKKVVVISDGKMTPIHIKSGKDLPDLHNEQLKIQLKILGHNMRALNVRIFFVPVGPYDSSLMEGLIKDTRGDEVLPANISRLYNWTRNTLLAIKLAVDCRKQHPGVSLDNEQFRDVLERAGSECQIGPDDIHLEVLDNGVGRVCIKSRRSVGAVNNLQEIDDMMKVAVEAEQTGCSYIECDANMPPIGTRVRRGPDWRWDNQDLEMPGTVVSHTNTGHIWVEWDFGNINRYRYGVEGCYDVVTSEDPRLLEDQIIAVGCVVRRSDGWKDGHTEDGGSGKTGSVFIVHDDGTVQVRWSNGKMGRYQCGFDGLSEVEICDPFHQRQLDSLPIAAGGEPAPNVLPKEEEELEEDPMVAEMNRKNALRSQEVSSQQAQNSDNIQRDKQTSGSKLTEQASSKQPITKDQSSDDNMKVHTEQLPVRSSDTRTDRPRDNIKSSQSERSRPKLRLDIPKSGSSDSIDNTGIDEIPEISIASPGEGLWQYKDGYGGWKAYSKEQSDKLEKGYCHNPKGVSLITVGKSQYRIMFSKFKQVNLKTKEMIDVKRSVSAS